MKKPFSLVNHFMSLAVMMVVAFALSACGGQAVTATPVPAPTTIPTTSPTTMPTTEPTTMPTTVPVAGQPTIKFETTGTIAGVQEALDLDGSGSASFTDGRNPDKKGTITVQQYADLVAQINKADFFNLKDKYDMGNVADDRYYTITVTDGTKTKSIFIAEEGGKTITPQALLDLVSTLNGIQNGL